ncbi:MAG: Ig-like domain-containing protein [Synergistaceae bacterium]|nr:Ig-like domain-containing protein [Synergistaceae bacterium]
MKRMLFFMLLAILFTCPAFAGEPVTGVSLDKRSMTISIGGTSIYEWVELNATVTPANATNKNVVWSSSNEAIATITSGYDIRVPGYGWVTGKTPGTAIITVTTVDGNFTSECVVEVVESDIQRANPRFFSDKNEVSAKLSGFSEDNFEIVDGNVVIKKSIAETIAKKLLNTDDIEAVPLPYFEAEFQRSGQNGKIAAVCNLLLTASSFDEEFKKLEEVEEVLILNITSSNDGEFLKHVEWMDYDDGMYAFWLIMMRPDPYLFPSMPPPNVVYLTAFIKDGGRYDLDHLQNGSVTGQIALVGKGKLKKDATEPIKPKDLTELKDRVESDKSGGSGCNTIFTVISLLLTGLYIFRNLKFANSE